MFPRFTGRIFSQARAHVESVVLVAMLAICYVVVAVHVIGWIAFFQVLLALVGAILLRIVYRRNILGGGIFLSIALSVLAVASGLSAVFLNRLLLH